MPKSNTIEIFQHVSTRDKPLLDLLLSFALRWFRCRFKIVAQSENIIGQSPIEDTLFIFSDIHAAYAMYIFLLWPEFG